MRKLKLRKVESVLLFVTLAVLMFNSFQIMSMQSSLSGNVLTGGAVATGSSNVLPKGVPSIYGKELGVSFDGVSVSDAQKADETIRNLAALDVDINLEGADLDRYINVLYVLNGGISCEYCCGARSVIFENGEKACGCAHSYAMRGLAKYLITEHGSEYTDEEILEEVGKWKTLFFPDIMEGKAEALAENGIEFDYINLASNKYRGIESGSGGSMVGGC